MAEPPSRFLPEDFSPHPIGLIAGKGRYPSLLAERIRAAGVPLRLIAFEDETDADLVRSVPPAERAAVHVGQLGKMLKALQRLGCRNAVMAGQITPKRLFHGLRPDLKTLSLLNQLKARNAETIFGTIASEIEEIGIRMLDARSFLDDQLAEPGLMTEGKLSVQHEDIRHGVRIAKGIADLDIGQGCVVRHGTVLAVEAYEGTDPMLQRAGSFKTDGLIFVKTIKRNQDFRFDVPVFGPRTLDVMSGAGIRTAALEAGGVLMLDKQTTVQRARALKITLYGFSSP